MKLILLELNEINFDIVKKYIKNGTELPGFSKIIDQGVIETTSEKKYEYLEPWIQWPSVHNGLTYEEHKIFRLGDAVNSNIPQIFEKIESLGFSVGAVSPMNTRNSLSEPKYFIPDPWTNTDTDDSYLSKAVSKAINQAVNDNSEAKLSIPTIFNLIVAFIMLVNPSKYMSLIKYALSTYKKPWRKALFLDKFLYEIHKKMHTKKSPDFSVLFLNAGAHIQHHYFFNSKHIKNSTLSNPEWYINKKYDPFLEMLYEYDKIIEDILMTRDCSSIIATGLSQVPYNKLKFYYRLKNHADFLLRLGINFLDVHPRMTRDFLITFNSSEDAHSAETTLKSIMVDSNNKLFGEIDNRGKDLFVVLTYPNEIVDDTRICGNFKSIKLLDHVVFVAIKNGMHSSKGFAFYSKNFQGNKPKNLEHVSKIHDSVLGHFKNNERAIS